MAGAATVAKDRVECLRSRSMTDGELALAAGFALAYGIFATTVAVVALVRWGSSLKREKETVIAKQAPAYVCWVRCDTQRPPSDWSARACGDDMSDLLDAVKATYADDKWDVLVLPNGERP